MKLTDAIKEQIDGMSYEDLLRRGRFAEVGDPMFQGEVGQYYWARLESLKRYNPAAAVAISKRIGWEK